MRAWRNPTGRWLLPCLALLTFSVAWRWPTLHQANYLRYAAQRLAYSDVVAFHAVTAIVEDHRIPYLQQQIEYPPLTGFAIWLAGFMPGIEGYFLASAIPLAGCLLGCYLLLERMGPPVAPARFALAPGLAMYAVLNWDALALLGLVAGMFCVSRRRFGWGGVWLAVGASAKLFPAFTLPVLLAYSARATPTATVARAGQSSPRWAVPPAALRLLLGFGGAALALNLPLAALNPRGWSYFLVFQAGRDPSLDAIWSHLPRLPSQVVTVFFLGVFVSGVAGAMWRVWRGGHWEAGALLSLLAFLLGTKVYSPQYDLWLLPLLALLACPLRLWLTFVIADFAYYAAIFFFYFLYSGGQSVISLSAAGTLLGGAVWGRQLALVLLGVWAITRLENETAAVIWARVLGFLRMAAARIPAPVYDPGPAEVAPRRLTGPMRLTAAGSRSLIVALLLIFCYGFFYQLPSGSAYSHYDLTVALVDRRTVQIDALHENTGEKVFFDRHYYSDKAPGTALLGAPVYGALRMIATVTGSGRPDDRQAMYALAFAVCGIPTALLALLLLRVLRPLVAERWALALSLGYGLGSIAFPLATIYSGQAASAFFLFAAFYLLWRSPQGGAGWRPALAGFCAGWAVLTESSLAFGLAIMLGYALWLGRWQAGLFLVGGLPPLLALLGYNWLAFAQPLGVASQYAAGGARAGGGGLAALGGLLWDARGLLRLSPWLGLAPLGLWAAWRRDLRPLVVICVALVVALLAYASGPGDPLGGWTPGPRFLLPALPFATLLVALAPRAFRPLIALHVAYAIALLIVATATMPNAPESYGHPVRELWLARLLSRDLAETTAWLRWGLHGLQPLFLLALALALALVALLATAAGTREGRLIVGAATALLVTLVFGFATPLDLRATGGPFGHEELAIVDVGVMYGPADTGGMRVAPWAQVANGDVALTGTKVLFSIYSPTGERVWAGWHSDVDWRPGERKRLLVEWRLRDPAPGAYRLDVTVSSSDDETVYTSLVNAARITIRPPPRAPAH